MEQRSARTNLLVGSFILGGIALFTVVLLFVGGKGEPFVRRILVRSEFTNIGGLLEGAPVRLAGVDIGSVQDIRFDTARPGQAVVVALSIDARAADRIARDAKAQIRQLGLLGDKYVEILQGDLDQGTVYDTRTLEGQAPFDMGEVYDNMQLIVDNIREASGKIGAAVDLYASPETAANLSRTVKAVRALSEEIRDGRGFLHTIVYEDAHKGILKDLGKASENLSSASLYLDALLKEAKEGKGGAHALIYGEALGTALQNLEETSRLALELARQTREGPGLANRVFYDTDKAALGKDFAALAANLREASAGLQQVSQNLREGKGTLGALIQDPALYEDLRILFGGAGRSKWLRYIIRNMVEENEKRALSDEP